MALTARRRHRPSETLLPKTWWHVFRVTDEKRVGVSIPKGRHVGTLLFFRNVRESTVSMTPEQTKTADNMKSVKAALDKAPSGPKKGAALKHFQEAEKANTAKNDIETNKELDAATHAPA